MVCSYLNNLEQGQTETVHGTLRRRAEKSRRRTHLVQRVPHKETTNTPNEQAQEHRLCQLNLQTLVLV